MTHDGFAFAPCDHLFTSPVLTSRHAARGCEGHPAARAVNAVGGGVADAHNAAMDVKGGNPKAPDTGRKRNANHETHGRLYGDVRP